MSEFLRVNLKQRNSRAKMVLDDLANTIQTNTVLVPVLILTVSLLVALLLLSASVFVDFNAGAVQQQVAIEKQQFAALKIRNDLLGQRIVILIRAYRARGLNHAIEKTLAEKINRFPPGATITNMTVNVTPSISSDDLSFQLDGTAQSDATAIALYHQLGLNTTMILTHNGRKVTYKFNSPGADEQRAQAAGPQTQPNAGGAP